MEQQSTILPLPVFYIGKQATRQLITNYGPKHALLTQGLGKPDTRSVWYSKEHIAQLMEEIEHAGGDGLRIFLGAYGANHLDFVGQTCLVMSITRAQNITEGVTIHKNVVLEEESDFAERSNSSRDMDRKPLNYHSKKDRDFNHGSPCPPSCDGDGGFDYP